MTPIEFKTHRESLGLSMKDLGEKLGVAKNTIYRLESGRLELKPVYQWAMRGLLKTQEELDNGPTAPSPSPVR